eukprot:CAMPEP_0184061256 /NCGR_PEP_ID=MMETSP0956-20121227/11366_1 /TAXON_ID=627963 /ORGANISM="Aplanochytrium sp, Strain PBS07" /LENGTH=34 /DNA_ID= /DNA_START= /DNA_END= /DNA_ORIENTATION=
MALVGLDQGFPHLFVIERRKLFAKARAWWLRGTK